MGPWLCAAPGAVFAGSWSSHTPSSGTSPLARSEWENTCSAMTPEGLANKHSAACIHVCRIKHLKCTFRLQSPAAAAQFLPQSTAPGPACQLGALQGWGAQPTNAALPGMLQRQSVCTSHLNTEFLPGQHLF